MLAFGLLAAYDIFLETARASIFHLVCETLVAGLALGWAARLLWQLRRSRGEVQKLQADVGQWREESAKWTKGLAQSIDSQLGRWKLTPAEKEIALLLMKGLEHKEIAQIRGTTERTARQQALGVYQKSGLSGRAELTAFFLEDLLTP